MGGLLEEGFERLRAVPDDSECLLEGATEVVELLYNSAHGDGVGKEQQLPRASDFSVLHNVQFSDGIDLNMEQL